ncbi:MAG TPA: hypothetical protein VHR45_12755 [Thermoanaerobaculia bacterium]|nr:hypothetical protein [Thermoanaerobaculia bacterium]
MARARALVRRSRRLGSPLSPHELDLEIHLPISPTPTFFTMVHYFAASLRLNGGVLAESRIVVSVGDDREPEDLLALLPWSRRYPMEWRWVDRDLYRRHHHFATAAERFRVPFRSSVVMLADADVFFTGGFGQVVESCRREGALAGLVAHISPCAERKEMSTPALWTRVFEKAGFGKPPLVCEHTGWGTMSHDLADRYCPPYFNFGMLVAPAGVMAEIGSIIYREMEQVDAVLATPYRCQIGLALAVQRLRVSWRPLAMRYNYPNDDLIASRYVDDLADVRLFHYLRRGACDKGRDFASPERVGAWLARRDLDGVNREMARHLAPVHAAVLADLA